MLLRSLLALLLLAGTALPSAILLSIPALAEDSGNDGGGGDGDGDGAGDDGGDGGADGSGGGAGNGNCGASSNDPGDCGCGSTSEAGFGGGGGEGGGGDGGGGFWTDEEATPVTNWTPILETTRFTLPVCGVHTAQGIGVGNRMDSTFAPGWGACRR